MRKCMDMDVRDMMEKRVRMAERRSRFTGRDILHRTLLPALVLGLMSSGMVCAAESGSAAGTEASAGAAAVTGVAGDDGQTVAPATGGLLHIVGGGKGDLAKSNNIQVRKSDTGNTITVGMSRNIYGLGRVEAESIRVGDLYIQTAKGKDWSISEIINLTNQKWHYDGGYVKGRAATEDQLHQLADFALDAVAKQQRLYVADDYKAGQESTVVRRTPKEMLALKGGATTFTENNIHTSVDAENGAINIKLGAELKGLTSIEAKQITGLTNTTWDADSVVAGRAATEGQLKSALSHIQDQVGSGQWTAAAGGKKLAIVEKDRTVLHFNGDGNIAVTATEKTEGTDGPALGFSLARDITGVDSITLGAAEDAGAVRLARTGLANGNNRITGVAAGRVAANSTDAVNGGQLYEMSGRMTSLEGRLGDVGAGAAALASLHPYDMSAADKWNLAVGYGHYDQKDALALGVFYKASPNAMLSAGATMGSGANMVTAGLSFKLDRGDKAAGSREEMVREIGSLKARLSDMEARYARLMDMLSKKN